MTADPVPERVKATLELLEAVEGWKVVPGPPPPNSPLAKMLEARSRFRAGEITKEELDKIIRPLMFPPEAEAKAP